MKIDIRREGSFAYHWAIYEDEENPYHEFLTSYDAFKTLDEAEDHAMLLVDSLNDEEWHILEFKTERVFTKDKIVHIFKRSGWGYYAMFGDDISCTYFYQDKDRLKEVVQKLVNKPVNITVIMVED